MCRWRKNDETPENSIVERFTASTRFVGNIRVDFSCMPKKYYDFVSNESKNGPYFFWAIFRESAFRHNLAEKMQKSWGGGL